MVGITLHNYHFESFAEAAKHLGIPENVLFARLKTSQHLIAIRQNIQKSITRWQPMDPPMLPNGEPILKTIDLWVKRPGIGRRIADCFWHNDAGTWAFREADISMSIQPQLVIDSLGNASETVITHWRPTPLPPEIELSE